MSDTKFTPGPWAMDAMGNVWGDDTKVCEMSVMPRQYYSYRKKTQQEHEANAHLIAAAPDLYEALVIAKIAMERDDHHINATGNFTTGYRKVLAALAKAKGEEHE